MKRAMKSIVTDTYDFPTLIKREAVVETVSEVVNSVDEVVKSHPGLRKTEIVPLVGKSG